MRKLSLILMTLLCLCAGNSAYAKYFYGRVYVHTVCDGVVSTDAGGAYMSKSNDSPTNLNSFLSGNNSYVIESSYYAAWYSSGNIDCYAFAFPKSGYTFVKWATNIEGTNEIGTNRATGKRTYSGISSTDENNPDEVSEHLYAIFERIPGQYSFQSSYSPSSGGGHFLLLSRSCDKLLQATSSAASLTTSLNDATVFNISNNASSTFTYNYNSVDYYWGQSKGGISIATDASGRTWTIEDQKSAQSGYYIKNKNGDSSDRFTYTDGSSVYFPKDNFTNYCRSWAFIPVFLFEATAPIVTGGTETWSPAVSKVIPTSSAEFDEGSTTATFAATPSTGYRFKGWWDNSSFTGDAVLTNASYTDQTVTNTNPAVIYTLYAKFVPVFNFSATATKNIAGEGGGTVSAEVANSEIEGTTPGQTSASTTATFTATPFTGDGYSFEGWFTPGGDLVSYDNPYVATINNTNLDGTTQNLTLQAHFTQKSIPVFTFSLKVGIVGQTYSNVFTTTNTATNLTSVTSSNPSVATVSYDLSARTISVTAVAKGQTTITVVQNGNEDWTNKTLSYVVNVVNQGEWIWQNDVVTSGDSYYVYSSSSGFLNDADGFDATPTLLWTVGGTALSEFSLTASSSKTLAVYDNNWKWNVKSSGTYSGGDITLDSESSNGYYSFWRKGGVHATFGYGAYYIASNNGALEMWSSASYEWLFVSSAQKAAYESYLAASEYVGDYSTLYPALENELSEVIGANNYESSNWVTCKANLDAIVAKCQAFDTDYAKFVTNELSLTPTTDGFATFYSACPVTLPSGVTAFKGSYSDGTLTLTDIDRSGKVPACTPVILHNDDKSNTAMVLTYYSGDVSAVDDNDLHGSSYPTALSNSVVTMDGKTGTAYALGYKNSTTGFYKYASTATQVSANKAILIINGGEAQAGGIRIIADEDNATGIGNLQDNAEVVKFFENGQLFIRRDGIVYDALGRIVK